MAGIADVVALPDHKYTAMENWGLITYRQVFIKNTPLYTLCAVVLACLHRITLFFNKSSFIQRKKSSIRRGYS